ncbi:hypothetical protein MHBO_000067 [Bonamia ostreae]|uniref:Histone acetyltransferase n=1 Tax=Bonamia ostreae TaxID=126728 RepID=A0ABV2AF90_9EUKA
MSVETPEKKESRKLVYCLNRKGIRKRCYVIDKKTSRKSNTMYYVHYENTDKRMDEWVTSERLENIPQLAQSRQSAQKQPKQPKKSEVARNASESCLVQSHRHKHARIKNIDKVIFGEDVMEAWYFSPISPQFVGEVNGEKIVYFCDFCLRFFCCSKELTEHCKRCRVCHPPGNEIYRSEEEKTTINVFEVDGAVEIEYSQNICYLSKLFLDHKTLQYDTSF